MIPKPLHPSFVRPHNCGLALYKDDEGNDVYICPKCFNPVKKEDINKNHVRKYEK